MGIHEEISKVAYELYEKSGRADGRDQENWLEAERIVLARRKAPEKKAQPALQPQKKAAATTPKRTRA